MSYRDVVSRRVLTWALVAVGARMPVAMAPLALVFLVRERPGGYTLGAALAAAYVVGEIAGAPVLGMRLDPARARPQLAAGLVAGAVGFTGLGAFPGAPAPVLAAFAFLAGAGPAAAPGGLRALLTSLVPGHAAAQALSAESMLTFAVWAVSPAAVTGLALGVDPCLPLLLEAALMASSAAGLWLLPAGWAADGQDAKGGRGGRDGDGGQGASKLRVLARAWPVYVTGAASLSLLALAELVLPALLEQRGIGVGWAGPLLTAMSVASAVGAFVYGLRSWPGRLRTRSVVLMAGTSAAVALVALIPAAPGMAAALAMAGLLQSGAMLTRNLSLREVLPPHALAAGYSVMYAAVGAGYATTGSLAGVLLPHAAPSTAILAGVALTLLLTSVGWWGEIRAGRSARGAAGTGPLAAAGPEGAAVRGGGDPERRL
ncbi:MFS transporter [Streptomyces sp. SID486]|uniref:MFS transporter n=1 Tax=unclassified Streptomyces TaxID=2593676 RepID=UPI00136CA169|nr:MULTISPECIES: MFS transporter [unclassified Streptomyces]MYW46467.1 MFS transporter [Streptomyces sp. SID161]MYX99309.1 MFS transporter [Streptomyces sp. SID486]